MLRSGRNYDANVVSRETGLRCDPAEDRAQQQFKDDADINTIVRRFGVTGKAVVTPKMPLVGDFADVADFHTAMNLIRQAEVEFGKVPAEIRNRFGNDPGQLVAFLSDEKNRDEAERLGLVAKRPEVDRSGQVVPVGPPDDVN